jgi:hypothetical protein
MKAENKTVKTITSNSRPLRRALCTLLLCIAALWAIPTSARAQLYVSQPFQGSIGEYNASTGIAINANFITGLNYPYGFALSGNTLFVANYGGTTVGTYNATTGAAINANFITGLSDPEGLAVSGDTLFVSQLIVIGGTAEGTTVGTYNATTGAVINANFITGLSGNITFGLAVSGNDLFVANDGAVGSEVQGTVGEYNATTGAAINVNFITGLTEPFGLAVSGNTLFVSNGYSGHTVGKYNASTGAAINANFITGLTEPFGLAVSGNTLFLADWTSGINTVGEYSATTGAAINANFITLEQPAGLAVRGPSCTLDDTATYDATSSTLTMNFAINTFAASTWNVWLTYQNTIEQLFSVSQPKTKNPPETITKTKTDLPKEGTVGVLSTLTTATGGIVCSNLATVNTGTP